MSGRTPAASTARNERFSIPLTTAEKTDLETVARAWGRNKTDFAREMLMAAVRGLPSPEPKIPLPTPRF